MGWFTHHIHTHLKASWDLGTRRRLSESGFSLTEVMAAVVVFFLRFGRLRQMQITAIKLNAGAHITTQMATLGQEQMENCSPYLYSPGSAGQRRSCGARDDILRVVSPEGIRP